MDPRFNGIKQRLLCAARTLWPAGRRPQAGTSPAPRPDDELREALRPARAQLTRQGLIDRMMAGALAAVGAAVGLLLFARLRPVEGPWLWCGLAAAAALAGAFALAIWRRPTWGRVAAAVDAAGLAERAVTALYFSDRTRVTEANETAQAFIAAERRDALQRLKGFDAAKTLPLRWPVRAWRGLATGLVAVLLLALWPNPMAAVAEQREAVRKAIADQVKAVEKVRREVEEKGAGLPLKTAAELQKTLEQLLKELKKAGPAEEALKALGQAQDKLAELAAAGERAKEAADGQALTDLASELKGTKAGQSAGEKLAAGDAKGAGEELQKLGDEAANLGSSDRRELAGALDRAAKSGAGEGPVAKAAAQAGKDLAGNDPGAAALSLQSLNSAVQAAMGAAAGSQAVAKAQSAVQTSQGAVVTAGQTGQSGSGSSGSGTGGPSGTGPGGSGAGSGSTNTEAGQRGEASNGPGSTNPGGASGNKTGTYEKLYDPTRLGGEGQTSLIGGRMSEGPSETTDSGQVSAGAGSLRPYDEIYGAYSREAMTAIDRAYLPASLRDLIKQYFSSLDPGPGR